jgi:hypothetical protein
MKAKNQDKTAMPAYRIQGDIYHAVNLALHPEKKQDPVYGQLFYIDTEEARDYRMNYKANQGCNREVMVIIDQALYEVNPYYESLRNMAEVEQMANEEARQAGKDAPEIRLLFDINMEEIDKNRYNCPEQMK